ncbi:ABC transporter permease [Bryobacter aggregatus]|uniref:ABC transporter permease n=1 Tax=Bryobacter aggregatus TaxID=360054 RepID=UPI000569CA0A|nr:ABC transporter permease [Bryobacter aggregatus]
MNLRRLFLLPAALVTGLLFLVPLGIVLVYSLMTRGPYGGQGAPWTIENYQRFFDPLYGQILLRSFLIATETTVLCLILGFPLAWFIARSGPRRELYLQLVMLPFWTSFLVRTYAWVFLLRDTGLFNTLLLALGIINEPLPLLYNHGAVLLGLVYCSLPLAVLPIYSTLERLDYSLVEAAADLGARPFETLREVVIPVSAPGLRAAAFLVFIPALGTYLTSDLLGGGSTILIGNLVQNQFTTARDWPFGAAASLILMGIVLIGMKLVTRKGEELM